MSDPMLLPPNIDPERKALGIRKVVARNDGTTRSVMMVRKHILVTDEPASDSGPTPLEMTLSALLGCEGVIINRCAEAMGFAYSAVDLEGEGEVDRRGSRGVVGVRPYFNWVRLKIRVHSSESPDRFEKLKKNVEHRCPVMNLFRAADVEVIAEWQLVAE
jgi:uncharacterized OsmC-like protein